jgi:hypothetical protein
VYRQRSQTVGVILSGQGAMLNLRLWSEGSMNFLGFFLKRGCAIHAPISAGVGSLKKARPIVTAP